MNKILKNSHPDGIHFLIEFFGCDQKQINNLDFWKKTLIDGAEENDIPILNEYFYEFDPEGITGFLLLASSHVSIHTWPEYGYVACDVFSCSPQKNTENLVEFIKTSVNHSKVKIDSIKRGYKFFDFQKIINERDEFVMPIFCNGDDMKIKIKEILGKNKSGFHDILFIDTDNFGRCLILDGIVQSSEKDHRIYDEAILKPLQKTDERILIIGGGDGYVAQKALEENPNLEIKLVDLDVEVIKGCEKYLDQEIFKDERVKVHIEDAFNYLKTTVKKNGKFDGIVCDLTDEPVRKKEEKNFINFYEDLLRLAKEALEEDGWISVQAGASRVTSGHIDAGSVLEKILENNFDKISRRDVDIPSFGEKNAFLYAKK